MITSKGSLVKVVFTLDFNRACARNGAAFEAMLDLQLSVFWTLREIAWVEGSKGAKANGLVPD